MSEAERQAILRDMQEDGTPCVLRFNQNFGEASWESPTPSYVSTRCHVVFTSNSTFQRITGMEQGSSFGWIADAELDDIGGAANLPTGNRMNSSGYELFVGSGEAFPDPSDDESGIDVIGVQDTIRERGYILAHLLVLRGGP